MRYRRLTSSAPAAAPLNGIKVLELAGLAAAPMCGHLLSDFGADVVRVDQLGTTPHLGTTAFGCGKSSIELDLKTQTGQATFRRLAGAADVVIEPYRPGVMERLGLGPEELTASNPRLVYARLTGWGQSGEYAQTAGHDINYIAISGALHRFCKPGGRPTPPINVLGDFAGGALSCAFGVALALLERRASGRGQVVDAAMLDGAAFLTSFVGRMAEAGAWDEAAPGTNMLDGGAPWYDTYRCSDGGFVAVGCIEPQFYLSMLDTLGLRGDPAMAEQARPEAWPAMRAKLVETFAGRTRDEWAAAFRGSDACVSPVLTPAEAAADPHNVGRGVFGTPKGGEAPRARTPPLLSRTPGSSPAAAVPCRAEGAERVLSEWAPA